MFVKIYHIKFNFRIIENIKFYNKDKNRFLAGKHFCSVEIYSDYKIEVNYARICFVYNFYIYTHWFNNDLFITQRWL